jgi:hypothetical protein
MSSDPSDPSETSVSDCGCQRRLLEKVLARRTGVDRVETPAYHTNV